MHYQQKQNSKKLKKRQLEIDLNMLNQKMNTMPNEYQYLIDRHAEVS